MTNLLFPLHFKNLVFGSIPFDEAIPLFDSTERYENPYSQNYQQQIKASSRTLIPEQGKNKYKKNFQIIRKEKLRRAIKLKASRKPKKKLTLLEKASLYRTQNPEKWQKRVEESEKKLNESLGIDFDEDPFLVNYYQEIEKAAEERKIREKLQIPEIKVTLGFEVPYEIKEAIQQHDTYESMFNNFNVYEKNSGLFEFFAEKAGEEPELFLTVSRARYLQNRREGGSEAYERCKIKCTFVHDVDGSDETYKTTYSDVLNGESRWNHVFILKGYSAEDLSRSYLSMLVIGKSERQKKIIGQFVLSGNNAKIQLEDTDGQRKPFAPQVVSWHKAIDKPGTSNKITIQLKDPSH